MLAAVSLTKRYGSSPAYEAVRGASLDLRSGEFVSIVGRSGSGKSTLMAMLGALTMPTQGKVLLDGTDIWTLPETELANLRCRQIGFIFQFPSLLSNLTAVDNVALPALLGRTMDAREAYVRAYDLLACVGLADRADACPGSMSNGEQRRAVIARALINRPQLLLADEPTSDLDEETENVIVDLLGQLQRTHSFGLMLVTHNLELARRAQRIYEMRQGVLEHLPSGLPEPQRDVRLCDGHPGLSYSNNDVDGIGAREGAGSGTIPVEARTPIRLGNTLLRGLQTFLVVGAVVLGSVLGVNSAISKYQDTQVRERAARVASLRHLALNSLRGDVRSVSDLGDGRYELTTYLQNLGGEPIYVMAPDLRTYVQVGTVWQEVTTTLADQSVNGVLKIEDTQTYRYLFDARLRDFAQLLPNYMHVRFSSTMLISLRSMPKHDVFERKDNYYVYVKSFDVADEIVLKRMRFPGKPPVWIPMPAH